jgi:hypothetical protein
MKHTADPLRNVILSCQSIRDARNLSHVCTNCCYGATGASLTAREATCTHVCHVRVHSKHKVPTGKIIMKGPRATTRNQLLPTTRSAKVERAISASFRATVRPRSSSGAPTATPNPETVTCTFAFPRNH